MEVTPYAQNLVQPMQERAEKDVLSMEAMHYALCRIRKTEVTIKRNESSMERHIVALNHAQTREN